jgi:hypothetical protein
LREFKSATSDIRSQIGIDDIADSVNDLKSGLSLTSDSPRPATETAAGAAVGAGVGAAVGAGIDAGVGAGIDAGVTDSAVDEPPGPAVADVPAPAVIDTVSADVPVDADIDGGTSSADEAVDGDALTAVDEPVDGSAYTVGDEPVDESDYTIADEAVDGDRAAIDADEEGDVGVEAFGSLTRRSASSSARTAAD